MGLGARCPGYIKENIEAVSLNFSLHLDTLHKQSKLNSEAVLATGFENTNLSWVHWYTTLVPATRRPEIRIALKGRSLRPATPP